MSGIKSKNNYGPGIEKTVIDMIMNMTMDMIMVITDHGKLFCVNDIAIFSSYHYIQGS